MTVKLHYGEIRALEDKLISALTGIADEGVKAGKLRLHVVTGRLRESFRSSDPERRQDVVTVKLIAGGVNIPGVVRERDEFKEVDYGADEETRHPQLRTYVVPALVKAVSNARVP